MIVTVSETKAWLRVDHDADDLLIGKLIDIAETWAENYTGRNLITGGSSSEIVTESLRGAVLLYVQALYEGEDRSMQVLIQAAENLAFPDRCNHGI